MMYLGSIGMLTQYVIPALRIQSHSSAISLRPHQHVLHEAGSMMYLGCYGRPSTHIPSATAIHVTHSSMMYRSMLQELWVTCQWFWVRRAWYDVVGMAWLSQ